MGFVEQERKSDSPLVERVWRSESDRAFAFLSRAENHSEIVIVKHEGRTTVSLRGPETIASMAAVSRNSECIGIVFKPGTFIPSMLPKGLMDRRDADLPVQSETFFQLVQHTWEVPTFENVDTFVARLVHQHVLVHDPEVGAVLQGHPSRLSTRALQYRFVRATGLSYQGIRQIERAQRATALLSQGTSVLDTVFQAGYFDQPHLAHSLRRFVGLTPLQICRAQRVGSLLTVDPAAPDSASS